jgi:alkylation response protein AidB-like acyl-CoA dehydrogenase
VIRVTAALWLTAQEPADNAKRVLTSSTGRAAVARSLLLSRRDLDFLLFEWLDATALTARDRFRDHDQDSFREALDLSQRLAEQAFAPSNQDGDRSEPRWDGGHVRVHPPIASALRQFADSGLLGIAADHDAGGTQFPQVVTGACYAWFQAANVSAYNYALLTIANANLIRAHGTPEQVARYAAPMADGRFFGTMCLSETQAGSSLADIATRAEPCADGTHRLFGSKMWISGGDHDMGQNIVHLVLARTPDGRPGTKGLSLFIVPKYLVEDDGRRGERNDVALAGLNHKMGQRGTTNTVLNFGEGVHRPGGAAGAVGYLIGRPGHGLAYMFHMMNEARIGVGLSATALGYTAYLKSVDYAATRQQGRMTAHKDPAAAPVPIIEHADVRRMLLAQKSYVEGALGLALYCALLLDEQQTGDTEAAAEAGRLLDILTPIAKSWPAQWCLAANDLAIQIHGGYGYTRDYEVEQHYRDNRLNQIHEGTHGIQALDLLGRKVLADDGLALETLLRRIHACAVRATAVGEGEAPSLGAALSAAVDGVRGVTARLWEDGDAARALANASLYLEAVGHVVVAWIWLEQYLCAQGRPGDFYDGKRQAARYFFRWELPKVRHQLDLLAQLDPTVTEMSPAWF